MTFPFRKKESKEDRKLINQSSLNIFFWLYFPKMKGYLKLIFWNSHLIFSLMAWILGIQFLYVLKQTNACSVKLIFGENGTDDAAGAVVGQVEYHSYNPWVA